MIEKSELDKNKIKFEIKKHYNLDIIKIETIDGGNANIYKLTDIHKNKYILKEFQLKFNSKTILKEVHVIEYLRKKKLPVPEYVTCTNNQKYFEHKGRIVILQKYIEGKTKDKYTGNKQNLLESAKYLGLLVNALEDYSYNDMFKSNIKKLTTNEDIEKSIGKYKNLIFQIAKADVYGEEIKKDLNDKIEMLKEIKKDQTITKITNITIKKTHGDYNVLQFIYDSNDSIKVILDFATAGELPIVWELARSYNYMDKECKNGEFNIDNLILYIKEYLKYSKLTKEDLKYLPYIYLIQLLSSTYGYKQYLQTNNLAMLEFGKERTNICRYLMKNKEIISKRLSEINILI